MTQSEFAKAKKGMTVSKVHGLFDTKGKREAVSVAGGYRFEIRGYEACSTYGFVSVGFENGKLSSKSAVF